MLSRSLSSQSLDTSRRKSAFGLPKTSSESIIATVEELPEECRKPYLEEDAKAGVAVKIISVFEIDMAAHSFSADFNINVVWNGDVENVPEIQFYNAIEIREAVPNPSCKDSIRQASKKADAGFDWFYRIHCRGVFRQRFLLYEFPFDMQELIIQVRLKRACHLVDIPWDLHGKAVSCDPRSVMMDDFSLGGAKVVAQYLPSIKFGKVVGYDPEALVVIEVARRPMYWVTNFGLLTSVLATFSFLCFALPVSEISGRLQIGFTLNLTVVASYYLMADKLPSVPYFTLLEKHLLKCIALTMLVLLENAAPAVIGEIFMLDCERWLVPLMFSCWIAYHVQMVSDLRGSLV